MDGENNGKPYFLMDDLGGTTIFGNIHIDIIHLPQEAVEAPLKSFSNHLKPALARRVRGSLGTMGKWMCDSIWI